MQDDAPQELRPENPGPLEEQEPYVPIELYRSAMVRTWGIVWFLLGFFYAFRGQRLSDDSVERVRVASQKGPVVYVLHTRSLVDYLALNEALRRRRLPLADYGTGISMTAFMPFLEALKLLRDKLAWFFRNGRLPNPVDVGWLTRTVVEGSHTAIFLRPSVSWSDFFNPPEWPDPVAAIVEAQASSRRPVQLLPVTVMWGRQPRAALNPSLEAVIGSEEGGGNLLKLIGVALGWRRGLVQVGEAVDLKDYLDRYPTDEDGARMRRLRLLLRRFLFREQRVVRGPRAKSPAWTRRLVLGSARVRHLVEAESVGGGRSVEAVQQDILQVYDKMAARLTYPMVVAAEGLARWLWNSIYQGVHVRPEDLERIRTAKRRGVAVLVPCHRSHLDYVLVSSVLHDNDLMIPHVIAGENLDFFPAGPILRRLGAIFIPRSFKGQRIFPALFQSYLTHLFRDGHTLEFFIEGGRSRTGKLLPPKLGVLGATVDAGVEAGLGREGFEVSWLPVSITYEQVAEESPYRRELGGGTKEREDVGALIRATRVAFGRYGRVHLRVGEPLTLSQLVAQTGPWDALGRERRGEELQRLGERILHRVNDLAIALPTGVAALALMAQPRAGAPESVLRDRYARFCALIAETRLECSPGLEMSLDAALERFRKGKLVESMDGVDERVWRILPDRRVTLEYYKNTLLHALLPGSLVGLAIRARGKDAFDLEHLKIDLRALLVLFRREFIIDPDTTEAAFLQRGLAQLKANGGIDEAGATVTSRARVSELAELSVNFAESYFMVVRALRMLKGRTIDEAELPKQVQKAGKQLLATQDIARAEAISLAPIQNALKVLSEDGLLNNRSVLELDAEGLAEVDARLRAVLRLDVAE